MQATVWHGVDVGEFPTDHKCFLWTGRGSSSRGHKAPSPGTEMALGRSSTPGRAKTLVASSSTTSRSGFCSSWVCGLVGVVLGRDPLLFGKTLSFITYLHLLANQSLVIRTLHENQGVHTPDSLRRSSGKELQRTQLASTNHLIRRPPPSASLWTGADVRCSPLSLCHRGLERLLGSSLGFLQPPPLSHFPQPDPMARCPARSSRLSSPKPHSINQGPQNPSAACLGWSPRSVQRAPGPRASQRDRRGSRSR